MRRVFIGFLFGLFAITLFGSRAVAQRNVTPAIDRDPVLADLDFLFQDIEAMIIAGGDRPVMAG